MDDTNSTQAKLIAERIARRVSERSNTVTVPDSSIAKELRAVRNGLSELEQRLIQIESQVRSSEPSPADQGTPAEQSLRMHSPWLAGVTADFSHPSQEKFGIEEATVAELVDFFQSEKTCSLEPGDKPCDHCAMCSSRGF